MKYSKGDNIIYRTRESFFVNTEALLVQYNDVLNIPWFTYLSLIRGEPELYEVLHTDILNAMSIDELLVWYMGARKHYNPLHDLWKDELTEDVKKELDRYLFEEMTSPKLGKLCHGAEYEFLTIPDLLKQIIQQKFCKDIYVYSEIEDANLVEAVHKKYGDDVKILYGNLQNHLLVLPYETTYIFSQFGIFDALIGTNRLNYSTLILPYDFRYNKNEDETAFTHDLLNLQKEYTFKIGMYNTLR